MVTAFVDMLGLIIVYPLLPFYAQTFGASPMVIGLLFASFSVSPRSKRSATATMSHASIRIGAEPMICEPADSAAGNARRRARTNDSPSAGSWVTRTVVMPASCSTGRSAATGRPGATVTGPVPTGLDGPDAWILSRLHEVIAEVAATRITERGATRGDDRFSDSAMEDRKKEGYF